MRLSPQPKLKSLAPLIALLGRFNNTMGTSVDDDAPKSDNWLDQ